ncbi:MAG: zf-HC2 domain-containing protein [Acidobacteria bacterium]|nr:zf-HC2 domain-containing protein [Acidobacteriota bacterium]
MEKCFDEGTLQAFLDNELDSGEARRVSRHIADCVSCGNCWRSSKKKRRSFSALSIRN